mgnify:FL=1
MYIWVFAFLASCLLSVVLYTSVNHTALLIIQFIWKNTFLASISYYSLASFDLALALDKLEWFCTGHTSRPLVNASWLSSFACLISV